jgi:HlyD family type I secretion membrane fusion protein
MKDSKPQLKIAESAINHGIKVLIIFAAIFLAWAIFLPIQSASIAEGTIVLDFNRKTIQHLEGGIIDQILVKEGQMVNEGDVLLYLHDIKAKSEQQILQERLWTMQLQKQRLIAQEENKQTLSLNNFLAEVGELSPADNEKLQEIATNQLRLFKAKKDKRAGEVKVLEKKLKSAEIKLKLFQKELSLIKPLVEEDNLPILRQLDLEKSIAETDEQAETARLQIANYKNEDMSEILKEIKESDMEIVALYNQLTASKDILKRSAITSPNTGKVMDIKYHTIGAVVPPAGEMMSIVPQHEELIVEAKVKPQDIDNIAIGLKAKVSLTAYNGKKVPKLNGEVINISPDIITNEQSRESYFLARVSINKKDIEKLKNKIELYPGMPAQVFIITGSRSLVSYLFTPISDSAYKAFREE